MQRNARLFHALVLLALCGAILAPPLKAQMLGPRPGYGNALLAPEHRRQKALAQQRQLLKEQAEKAAAAQAAQNATRGK